MSEDTANKPRIHWFARLEHRLHVWRESRARRRGRTATVLPFAGYGGTGWVRVVGRVLIVPPRRRNAHGDYESVRGWRSFVGIPVGFSKVTITIAGSVHEVIADRGGVIDTVLDADLEAGWQTFTMSVEGQAPIEGTTFIVGDDVEIRRGLRYRRHRNGHCAPPALHCRVELVRRR